MPNPGPGVRVRKVRVKQDKAAREHPQRRIDNSQKRRRREGDQQRGGRGRAGHDPAHPQAGGLFVPVVVGEARA